MPIVLKNNLYLRTERANKLNLADAVAVDGDDSFIYSKLIKICYIKQEY
jgi:hypothetical protein